MGGTAAKRWLQQITRTFTAARRTKREEKEGLAEWPGGARGKKRVFHFPRWKDDDDDDDNEGLERVCVRGHKGESESRFERRCLWRVVVVLVVGYLALFQWAVERLRYFFHPHPHVMHPPHPHPLLYLFLRQKETLFPTCPTGLFFL